MRPDTGNAGKPPVGVTRINLERVDADGVLGLLDESNAQSNAGLYVSGT